MAVRFGTADDVEAVNALRRQVNDLHVAGMPAVFKDGFSEELRNYAYTFVTEPAKSLVVSERDGKIVGFAMLNRIVKGETPYTFARDFLDIDEFGVDESHRREGIGSEMIAFIREFAKESGFDRIELNMWTFNEGALEFYEAVGFTTYRRYMEMKICGGEK